ncbi:hypothetical protein J6590_080746 [Homalodisca vitripennis]|nr:hypothetical protein J6590_080746 [Homalodisca vitripennis]
MNFYSLYPSIISTVHSVTFSSTLVYKCSFRPQFPPFSKFPAPRSRRREIHVTFVVPQVVKHRTLFLAKVQILSSETTTNTLHDDLPPRSLVGQATLKFRELFGPGTVDYYDTVDCRSTPQHVRVTDFDEFACKISKPYLIPL